MIINKIMDGDLLNIALDGRLDTKSAPELQELLIPAFCGYKRIELDLKGLEYISSAGLRIFLLGEKEARAKGASMTLKNVSEDVMEILDMTGFTDMLTIE